MILSAYVDESIRAAAGDGVYVLAAAVLPVAAEARVRDAIMTVVVNGDGRFHWHREGPKARRRAVRVLATLDEVAHHVVVGCRMDPKRQERARACCMERLLFELDRKGVEAVRLEARGDRGNSRDITTVTNLRRTKVIGSKIHVSHAYPSREPLLWLPDIVAGAVSAGEKPSEAGHFVEIAGLIVRYDIDIADH